MQTVDGREVEVRHPECLLFSRSGRTLAPATAQDSIKVIDLLLIVALEHLDGRPKRARRDQ